MGLSIRALSKATHVVCDGNAVPGDSDGDACDHETAQSFPLGREGLKCGCYVHGKGGREFSFELNCGGYARWFDELYLLLYEVDANGVDRLFRRHRGKPFVEFVDVPCTSDGQTIGPKMCAKLHGDFVAFAVKARKHLTRSEDLAWMWEVYRDFRKAFKIGSEGGLVCYW